MNSTGVFEIYKDAFGDEAHLFAGPLENNEATYDLPDEQKIAAYRISRAMY